MLVKDSRPLRGRLRSSAIRLSRGKEMTASLSSSLNAEFRSSSVTSVVGQNVALNHVEVLWAITRSIRAFCDSALSREGNEESLLFHGHDEPRFLGLQRLK